MTYNKKTINAIIERAKVLLQHDPRALHLIEHYKPEIIMGMDNGKIELKEIRFKHHFDGSNVIIYPGHIHVQSGARFEFDYEGWEHMMDFPDNSYLTLGMLESGMLATTLEGKTYVVMRGMTVYKDPYIGVDDDRHGALFEIGGDEKIPLCCYRDDLKSKRYQEWRTNIVKVSKPINYGHNKTLEEMGEEIIWQRELEEYEKQLLSNLQAKNSENE